MAEDSKTSDVRARWQAVARACFERAMDLPEKAVKRRDPLGRYSSMHDGVCSSIVAKRDNRPPTPIYIPTRGFVTPLDAVDFRLRANDPVFSCRSLDAEPWPQAGNGHAS